MRIGIVRNVSCRDVLREHSTTTGLFQKTAFPIQIFDDAQIQIVFQQEELIPAIQISPVQVHEEPPDFVRTQRCAHMADALKSPSNQYCDKTMEQLYAVRATSTASKLYCDNTTGSEKRLAAPDKGRKAGTMGSGLYVEMKDFGFAIRSN